MLVYDVINFYYIIDNFVISRKGLYFKGLVRFGVSDIGIVLW